MISIVKESILECTSGLSCSLNTESIIQWIVIYPVESAIHRLNNQGRESLQKSGLYPHNKNQDFVYDGWSFLLKFLSHCKRLFSPFFRICEISFGKFGTARSDILCWLLRCFWACCVDIVWGFYSHNCGPINNFLCHKYEYIPWHHDVFCRRNFLFILSWKQQKNMRQLRTYVANKPSQRCTIIPNAIFQGNLVRLIQYF